MKFLQKVIPKIFIVVFLYILCLMFFFGNIEYITKASFMIENIYALFFIGIVILLFYKYKDENAEKLSDKKFVGCIIIFSIVSYIAQLIVQRYCFFKTGWDAGLIEENAYYFKDNGMLLNPEYMTRYPNNLFIVFILTILLKLPIPIIGGRRAVLLIANSFQINVACILACLTIYNITKNKKLALSSFLITIPLIMLNPWILIFYSDTFSMIYPIAVIYLYTKDKKSKLDLFLIIILSLIGYFIKPTAIIVLIAIVIIEIFKINYKAIKKVNIKKCLISVFVVLFASIIAFSCKRLAVTYLKFKPVENVYEFTLVHFLNVGQNDKRDGIYSEDDCQYSMKYGMDDNFNRFKERLTSRSLIGQVKFFSRKTLVNFNNGGFCWGVEGTFYKNVPESTGRIMDLMRSIFYSSGENYKYLLQIEHWIWLLVLFMCPFVVKKENSYKEIVIMLAILGITAFLTIFEARTRYLYCYSPVFVVCAILGFYNLRVLIKDKVKLIQKNRKSVHT